MTPVCGGLITVHPQCTSVKPVPSRTTIEQTRACTGHSVKGQHCLNYCTFSFSRNAAMSSALAV